MRAFDPESRREELEEMSPAEQKRAQAKAERQYQRLIIERDAQKLVDALARRRAMGLATSALSGARLDVKIERLFEAIREKEPKLAIGEILEVFDGILGRILSKRLWIALLALMTIMPAFASLWLLARQNGNLIAQNQVQEDTEFRANLLTARELVGGKSRQMVLDDDRRQVLNDFPKFAPRIRREAFSTLVSLEKARWQEKEKVGLPASRWVDLRGIDLSGILLGNSIGLREDLVEDDFTRIFLANSNLTGTKFHNVALHHSVFRDASAAGIAIISPGADFADFSGIDGRGAFFSGDFSEAEPLSMEGANLNAANFEGAHFLTVLFTRSSFAATNLKDTTWTDCAIFACDFTLARLDPGVDWTSCRIDQCLVREDQLALIQLPQFCFTKPTKQPGVLEIMTDIDQVNEWHEKNRSRMNRLAEEEMEQLNARKLRIEDALKRWEK